MSWLTLNIRRQREFYEYEKLREFAYTGELIGSWKTFEEVSRELLEFEGDTFNRYSLRSIISKLRQEEKITDADLRVLQEALRFVLQVPCPSRCPRLLLRALLRLRSQLRLC